MPTTEPISSFYIQRAANGGWVISLNSSTPHWIAQTDKEMVAIIANSLSIQPPNPVARIWQWAGRLLREE